MKNKFNKLLLLGLIILPMNTYALDKHENVYEVLNRDGSRNSISVTNRLSYIGDSDITDETELRNILNISGDEEFEQRKNNLTWKNSGKEILYTGTTDKKSPITTSITYKLNNEDININDLIGKEGNVEITINLENTDINYINGNKLYTPFVTTVATIIDNNTNNIDISNGKVIQNGEKNFAVGIAAPGLYDSIGLKDLKDLNKIVIKYYTHNFSYHDIYVVSTPKLLSNTDMDIFNKIDTLTSDINTLQMNMNKIQKGSNKVNDGTKDLNKYLKQANSGINQLSEGADKLATGVNTLYTAFNASTSDETLAQLQSLLNSDKEAITTLTTKLATAVNTTDLDSMYVQIMTLGQGTCPSQYTDFCTNYKMLQLLKYNYASVESQIKMINSLKQPLKTINDGTKEISTNLKKVKSAISSIYNGSTELKNGMNELNTGIETFNKEGINKLSDYADKIDNYSDKVQDLVKLSKKYNGFASDNADETMFITVIK
jgi:X-X-X-Leu-X-X-Gly heptad repeat protein